MTKMKLFMLSLIFLTIYVYQTSANQDIYLQWVNWTGIAPLNAVESGYYGNETVYIARVYYNTTSDNNYTVLDAKGWVPASLIEGQTSVEIILMNATYRVYDGIQVLTKTPNARVEWRDVDNISFPRLFDTEDFHVARSGWELEGMEFNGTVYIGKVQSGNNTIIGKIFTTAVLWAENNILYYVDDHNVQTANEYSALIYYY